MSDPQRLQPISAAASANATPSSSTTGSTTTSTTVQQQQQQQQQQQYQHHHQHQNQHQNQHQHQQSKINVSKIILPWHVPHLLWIWIAYIYETMTSFVSEFGTGMFGDWLGMTPRNNNGGGSIINGSEGTGGIGGGGGLRLKVGVPDLELVPQHDIDEEEEEGQGDEDTIITRLGDNVRNKSNTERGNNSPDGIQCLQTSSIPPSTETTTTTATATATTNKSMAQSLEPPTNNRNANIRIPEYNTNIEPAFLTTEEYPLNWLVYDPVRGLTPKFEVGSI